MSAQNIVRVYFRILTKGGKTGCNGMLGGAKWYDPPGSEHIFDKLWDPRICMFPDQRHIIKVWYFV